MLGVTQNCKILPSRSNFIRCISVSSVHPPVDTTAPATPGSMKSFKEIPGPSSLPFFGPLHNFLPGGAFYKMDRLEMFKELLRLYGPIVRLDKLANQPNTILLYDAKSVETIFRGEDQSSPRRALVGTLQMYRQKYNKYDIGVLINGTGPEWKKVRSPANQAMMNPKLVHASYSKTIDDIAKEAVARFQIVLNEKDMITNFNEEVKLWAMENTTAVTLGRRLHSFNRELPEDSYEKRLISLIHTVFNYVEAIDFQHDIFQNIFFWRYWQVMKAFKELESLILAFLDDSMKDWKSKEGKDTTNDLHACTIEKILYRNKNAALGVAIDSLIAGVDAVSQAMLFLLYFLASHPEKQLKLRQEVLSREDRKPYLKACMKESLRLIPTAFANTRLTTKSHEAMGYTVPKDTLIVVPQEIVSTMESHYPRATEFIPERWLVEEGHPLYYGNAHPFTYMPFGFGIRTCAGRRIVNMMMEALAVHMIKNFEITWVGPPPTVTLMAFNKMNKPFSFVFKRLK